MDVVFIAELVILGIRTGCAKRLLLQRNSLGDVAVLLEPRRSAPSFHLDGHLYRLHGIHLQDSAEDVFTKPSTGIAFYGPTHRAGLPSRLMGIVKGILSWVQL